MKAGFTLIEMVITIAIMGIILGVASVNYTGFHSSAKRSSAIMGAQSLNIAMQTYRMRVTNAENAWANAADDSERFLLVQPYLGNAAQTLSAYTPDGFSYDLPDANLTVRAELYQGADLVIY